MYHMVLSHSFNMNQFIIPLFKILGISEKIRDEVYDADLIPKGPVFSSNSIALVPKPEDIRRKSYQPISTAAGLINANGGLRGYSTTGTGTGTPGNTVPLDFAAYAIQERGRKDSRRTSEGSQQYALSSSISPGGYSPSPGQGPSQGQGQGQGQYLTTQSEDNQDRPNGLMSDSNSVGDEHIARMTIERNKNRALGPRPSTAVTVIKPERKYGTYRTCCVFLMQ